MSPEANPSPDAAKLHAAAIRDPELETGFDPDTIAELMRERGVSEIEIATVERPGGFRVGFVNGKLVEL